MLYLHTYDTEGTKPMSEKLIKVLDKLSHDMSLSELQQVYANRSGTDLSYHDMLYLNIIMAHPNKYTSSQIADLLKITRPAVTQKINELTKKGYIVRTQSKKDKRIFYLATHPEKTIYTEKDIQIELKISKQLTDKYGEEKVDLMCEMLEYLSDALFTERTKGTQDDN